LLSRTNPDLPDLQSGARRLADAQLFYGVPRALEDAVRIDGRGDWNGFRLIASPLAGLDPGANQGILLRPVIGTTSFSR
jgi:hypothetical protein